MKTSTILLAVALVVALGTLTAYNFSLKASYETGDYKKRFNNFTFLPANGIESLNVKSGERIRVMVETGSPEGLWIRKASKNNVDVNISGSKVSLSWHYDKSEDYERYMLNDVVLVTNHLTSLNVSVSPTVTFKDLIKPGGHFLKYGKVILANLSGKQLALNIGGYSSVDMLNVKFDSLNAVLASDSVSSELMIDHACVLEDAHFTSSGPSRLDLGYSKIGKTKFNMSENSSITLTGSYIKHFK